MKKKNNKKIKIIYHYIKPKTPEEKKKQEEVLDKVFDDIFDRIYKKRKISK